MELTSIFPPAAGEGEFPGGEKSHFFVLPSRDKKLIQEAAGWETERLLWRNTEV